MRRVFLLRLAQALLVLLLMSVVIYALIGLMPGDPIDLMISANPDMTPQDAARLRALYGLDQPLWQRYLNWLGAALGGDFGHSRLFSQPVLDLLWPAMKNSLLLVGSALLLAISLAVPLGVLAAARPRSPLDYAINLFAFAGVSMPSFWLALLLIIVFSVQTGWLPAGGLPPAHSGPAGLLRHLALPVWALGMLSMASYVRYVRAAMIEVLRQDYIRSARAKGVGPVAVIWKHALRNALIPVVTILALDFGTLFSGALITETIFAWPGMGKLIYDAILGNDFNLALVALLCVTGLTLAGNFLADIAYAALDPRIRLGGARR